MNDELISLLHACLVGYMVVAICKFTLMLGGVPIAIGTMSRHCGKPRGRIYEPFIVIVPVLLLIFVTAYWIPMLYHEGFRFFRPHRRRAIIRECVIGNRNNLLNHPPTRNKRQ